MTNQTAAGRPTAQRTAQTAVRLLCCGLLWVAALPAVAQQAAVVAEATVAPAAASVTLSSPALLPIPGQGLTADTNRLFDAEAGTPSTASTTPGADTGGRIQSVLKRALSLLGTPYRWGGTTPETGFDCSGLIGYVFRTTLGIELPRVSRDLAKNGQLISDRAALAAGDLVFFGKQGRVDHVGIYLGDGNFVHSPRTGRDVMVSSLASGYWSGRYLQARRVAGI